MVIVTITVVINAQRQRRILPLRSIKRKTDACSEGSKQEIKQSLKLSVKNYTYKNEEKR